MQLEEVRIGTRVRVKEGYRKPEMRGLLGTVEERWGNPNHRTALLVRLEDRRYELFWDHELGEVGNNCASLHPDPAALSTHACPKNKKKSQEHSDVAVLEERGHNDV